MESNKQENHDGNQMEKIKLELDETKSSLKSDNLSNPDIKSATIVGKSKSASELGLSITTSFENTQYPATISPTPNISQTEPSPHTPTFSRSATHKARPKKKTPFDFLIEKAEKGEEKYPSAPVIHLEFPIGKLGKVFKDQIIWDIKDPETPDIAHFAASLKQELGISDNSVSLVIAQMKDQLERYMRNPLTFKSLAIGYKPKTKFKASTSNFTKRSSTSNGSVSSSVIKRMMEEIKEKMNKKIKPKKVIKNVEGNISCHICQVPHPILFYCCNKKEHGVCKRQLVARYMIKTQDCTMKYQCNICKLTCTCKSCQQAVRAQATALVEKENKKGSRKRPISQTQTVSTSKKRFLTKPSTSTNKKSMTNTTTNNISNQVVNDSLHALHGGRKQCLHCKYRCNLSDQFCSNCWKIFEGTRIGQNLQIRQSNIGFCGKCFKGSSTEYQNLITCMKCPRSYHSICISDLNGQKEMEYICSHCSHPEQDQLFEISPEELNEMKKNRNFICHKILTRLMKHDLSFPFSKPINSNILTNYKSIISHPMDFDTIYKKIFAHKYPTIDLFFQDLQLIWSNSRNYNSDVSTINTIVNMLEGLVLNWIKKFPLTREEILSIQKVLKDLDVSSMMECNEIVEAL